MFLGFLKNIENFEYFFNRNVFSNQLYSFFKKLLVLISKIKLYHIIFYELILITHRNLNITTLNTSSLVSQQENDEIKEQTLYKLIED